ncbi:uncharacterized protein VP01_1515g2 [Puccinia sorghi]|uniref:Trehalase n=1 Tax=Puccinia sorghi TaxID=27349 RepID=A0A0L6VIX0_9BASI|nr:uncharacterized protein VP01_1515g2 [Puccinia sorghi]
MRFISSTAQPAITLHSKPSETRRARMEDLSKLMNEISLRWASLVRSNLSLVDLLEDPKLPPATNGEKRKLYVRSLPGDPDSLSTIRNRLCQENPAGELHNLQICELPPSRYITDLADHGTLYLPYPYVVPGGRFQEMYAWDSFFIALGLLRDKQGRLARNMLDNYIYQLPFLTPLIKLILPTVNATVRQAWLSRAIAAAETYHHYWTSGAHLTPSTGLSRFFDFGTPGTPPPEIIHESDPVDGSSAHDRVKKFFRQHYHQGIPDYNISEYYNYEKDELTAKFMDNDRAMRESGFDTSNRFGPFNSRILDFNPVCLNSLIYLMEKEIGELYGELEPTQEKDKATLEWLRTLWAGRAAERRRLVQKYNWDETHGLYFDYDYVRERRREYVFGTTFLPLWTGLAEPAQAARAASVGLMQLEIPGGLSTSAVVQGDQWDKPYVWAPLQLFAVDGLARYGMHSEAHRLAANFGSMVLKSWLANGSLWEKYNGTKRDSSVDLKFGYPTNEPGFGWTNALFTHFYDQLKAAGKLDHLLLLDGLPVPHSSSRAPSPPPADLVQFVDDAEWVHVVTVPSSCPP